MPNPQKRYEALANTNNLSAMTIHIPNVQDSHGKIISPTESDNKIVDGTVVELKVVPKLYLYLFSLHH